MRKFSEEELDVFYKLDLEKYKIKKNKTVRNFLNTVRENFEERDIQNFIDKLIAWYGVKYSDMYVRKGINGSLGEEDKKMVEIMDMERLINSFNTVEVKIFSLEDRDLDILRKYLVEMAGCGLIYATKKNSRNPYYGYYRAKKLFEECNVYFGWDLSVRMYDEIMERDYSPYNEENMRLLEKKVKHDNDKRKNGKKKKRVRSLFGR